MSATNSTANYGLPIFVSSDVPSWLTDWNGAMGDIDTAIAAAKAVADSALLASGNNTSDITTIQGQITSLQNTVGTHTTQIGTISGNINTINSLIGNGTPTTTDQTLIGAINELHANQGDLTTLTTTDKTSLVAAINEVAGGGGSVTAASVSYDNTGSGLSATDVQDAIDEVAAAVGAGTYSQIMSESTTGTYTANVQNYKEFIFGRKNASDVLNQYNYVHKDIFSLTSGVEISEGSVTADLTLAGNTLTADVTTLSSGTFVILAR